MYRVTRWTAWLALIVAACIACRPHAPPRPTALSLEELMERVIDPPADRFWESSGTIITAAGETSRAPTTDAGWTDAVNAGFDPWETIHDANPQEILERREPVTLAPMLIMQGALDEHVLPAIQEKFAATYRAAGGVGEPTVFEDSEHEWVAKPGPHTDRAREMVKAFIARHSKA